MNLKALIKLFNNRWVRLTITPSAPETILKNAREQFPQLTKTNTELIDDYTLDGLLKNKEENGRSLNIDHVIGNVTFKYYTGIN